MKRKDLAPQAENMYVCSQMEFKEIAVELNVSERSLRVWAKRDNWKEKRSRFLDCVKPTVFKEFRHYLQNVYGINIRRP